jgi:dTDP-4-dehydrorhamnose reductase
VIAQESMPDSQPNTLASMCPPLPLLITGVAGVAGYNALDYFRTRYPGQVFGIRQRDNWPLVGEGVLACNAEDPVELTRLFDEHQFKSVLNCAGNCALKSCELDPVMARRINVDGIANLLSIIQGSDTRLVHLSIDLVFSGATQGDYTEDHTPDPVTVYGQTMVESERCVQEARPAACILRISLPMGVSFNGHAGAIDWIQSRFKKDKPATLYYDEVRTPTYNDCLNDLFDVVLASDLAGVFHAGGPRKLSLFEIAQVINRVGGYDPDLLMGCPRIEAGPIPPRAGNVTMCSDRLTEALGQSLLDPWPYDESLVPNDRQWHYNRPAAEQGSPQWLAEVLHRNPARRTQQRA